jgi:hypothetical protein
MSGNTAEENDITWQQAEIAGRAACALCGRRLRYKRRDSRFCSDTHRAEASRFRRLLAGEVVDECESLAEYLARRQRRTRRPWEPEPVATEREV